MDKENNPLLVIRLLHKSDDRQATPAEIERVMEALEKALAEAEGLVDLNLTTN